MTLATPLTIEPNGFWLDTILALAQTKTTEHNPCVNRGLTVLLTSINLRQEFPPRSSKAKELILKLRSREKQAGGLATAKPDLKTLHTGHQHMQHPGHRLAIQESKELRSVYTAALLVGDLATGFSGPNWK